MSSPQKNELLCSNVSGCCSFNNTTNSGFEILFSSFYRSQFLQKVCGIIRYEKTRFSWKSDVLKCWRICCLVFSLRFCEFWKQACLNLLFETSRFEIILHIITTSSSKKTKKKIFCLFALLTRGWLFWIWSIRLNMKAIITKIAQKMAPRFLKKCLLVLFSSFFSNSF